MALNINGTAITKVTLNGVALDKLTLDGVDMWSGGGPKILKAMMTVAAMKNRPYGYGFSMGANDLLYSGKYGHCTPTAIQDTFVWGLVVTSSDTGWLSYDEDTLVNEWRYVRMVINGITMIGPPDNVWYTSFRYPKGMHEYLKSQEGNTIPIEVEIMGRSTTTNTTMTCGGGSYEENGFLRINSSGYGYGSLSPDVPDVSRISVRRWAAIGGGSTYGEIRIVMLGADYANKLIGIQLTKGSTKTPMQYITLDSRGYYEENMLNNLDWHNMCTVDSQVTVTLRTFAD